MQLLRPTSEKIQAIQDLREKNRASEYFNHLSAISESIPALGWVTVVSLVCNCGCNFHDPINTQISKYNFILQMSVAIIVAAFK